MPTAVRAYQQAGESALREQLILDNIDFARKVVSTLAVGLPAHCDRENLEQAGLAGLVEAAVSFEPARGVKFRTFAYPRIRGAVIDEMRRNSLIPQSMMDHIALVKRAYEGLPRPVTPEMLANQTGLSVESIQEVLEAMRFIQPQSWNDLECHIHSSWQRAAHSPDAELEAQELKKLVADHIEKLPERERLVLTLYFAEDLTLVEIGQVLDLSESRVSRILAAAKFRLKEMIEHGNA